jgi:hypothetical protein
VHAGCKLTSGLSVHSEVDRAKLRIDKNQPYLPVAISTEREFLTDYTLGLKYDFNAHLALKTETHWMKGFANEDTPPDFSNGSPVKMRYTIVSFSASF